MYSSIIALYRVKWVTYNQIIQLVGITGTYSDAAKTWGLINLIWSIESIYSSIFACPTK